MSEHEDFICLPALRQDFVCKRVTCGKRSEGEGERTGWKRLATPWAIWHDVARALGERREERRKRTRECMIIEKPGARLTMGHFLADVEVAAAVGSKASALTVHQYCL